MIIIQFNLRFDTTAIAIIMIGIAANSNANTIICIGIVSSYVLG